MKTALTEALKHHWIEATVAFVAIAALHLPLLADTFKGNNIDATNAADYGQFLSGYAGTIILIISVAALVIQLRNQIATNRRTSFESRFFELLRYHRENVAEIGIGSDKSGRRVFVSLIREFREVLKIVDKACAGAAPDYPRLSRLDLAYMAFYYGVGPNSTRVLKDDIDHHPQPLADEVVKEMERIQSEYRRLSNVISNASITTEDREYRLLERSQLTRLSYCPFDGHQSRLAHYYRHFFQLIKYLDDHAPAGTGLEYAAIARAQLTNHEQALLCLDALAPIGEAWIKLGYLTKYSLIKNIPRSFFNKETELDLESQFPLIRFEFMHGGDSQHEPNRALT
jgi:hypothetical protein